MATTYNYGGITEVLNRWAELGVFAYVLPFLLIFAMVFGILNKTKIIGGNRGVQATIALAVGLLSLQFDYVPNFFATIFPYTGIGLSVLLVALILGGLVGDEGGRVWIWFGVGAVIFFVVLVLSLSDFAFFSGYGYSFLQDWPVVLMVILVLAIMAVI